MRTTDCVKAPRRRRFSRTRAREEGPGDPELGPRAIRLALVLCTLIVHYSTHFVYKRQPPPVLTRPAREPRESPHGRSLRDSPQGRDWEGEAHEGLLRAKASLL